MRKAVTLVATGAAAAAISVCGVASASASTPSPKLNKTDIAFAQGNHFVNLFENRVGTFVVNHAKDQTAVGLARETRNDHAKVDTRLLQLSKQLGIKQYNTLPAKMMDARIKLEKSKVLNYNYYVGQVAGHKESIAATNNEIKNGHDHQIKVYAKHYLPYAQAHLRMATADLKAYEKAHPQKG